MGRTEAPDGITRSCRRSIAWSEQGDLTPGVVFKASQTVDSDPTDTTQNTLTLVREQGAFHFTPSDNPTKAGKLGIVCDACLPTGMVSVGVAMSGKPTQAVVASPSLKYTFSPHPRYWIAFGKFEEGEVIDINRMTQKFEIKYPATCQSFWTLAMDDVWDTFVGDYSKVVEVLNIWPVFHFLLGKYGRIVEVVYNSLIGHTDPRFELAPLLICGTESDLTAALVGDAATAYAGNDTYEYKLSRIGIAMHTLADTFAHQGFAGLPLKCINEVSAVKTATDRTNLHQKLYMPAVNYSPAPPVNPSAI